jgi:D-amino-acid dehydrogenase
MKAVIIGGGIIGLCSAYYLQKNGWQVTVIDKGDLSDNCSYGNMGMIVPSHFVPLAAPGMISQGIKWMFNNKSPFYVKPSLDLNLLSWGLKFMKTATAERVNQVAPYLLEINLYSKRLYEELANSPGFDFGMENKGIVMYYKTQKVAEEEMHLAEKARSMGIDAAALNQNEIQQLEPQLELNVLGGVYYRCDAHLYPNQLMHQLTEQLKAAGVIFRCNETVTRIHVDSAKIKKITSTKGDYDAEVFVLAGGALLPALTKMAGVKIPLMPGKGYSITDKQPKIKLNIPAILCEARVAITPMNGYMRYGGTMEIAPVNDRVNLNRVEGIVRSIPEYFPSMRVNMPEKKDIWFGFRPCSPDGLPYLGRLKKLTNCIIAGGHAMMGLSLAPATGKIVADIVDGRTTEMDITVFDPERYS